MEAPDREAVEGPPSGLDPDEVELRCFPSGDGAFAAFAHATLVDSREERVTPETLQRRLRAVHPVARVREQSPLGTLSPGYVIWYVFRDG